MPALLEEELQGESLTAVRTVTCNKGKANRNLCKDATYAAAKRKTEKKIILAVI